MPDSINSTAAALRSDMLFFNMHSMLIRLILPYDFMSSPAPERRDANTNDQSSHDVWSARRYNLKKQTHELQRAR
jgi:hypothetical protein